MSDKRVFFNKEQASFDDSAAHKAGLNYAINFLWLNKRQESSELLWGQGLKGHLDLDVPLKKWRETHPDPKKAEINLWYDARLTTKEAIKNTKEILNGCHIRFRDIQEIPFVKDNPRLFGSEMPLMWKIDFLKLVICAYCMENEGKESAIFSDFSIGLNNLPVPTYEDLYEGKNFDKLQNIGMLLGRKGPVENQFIVTSNTPELLEALIHTINAILLQTIAFINSSLEQGKPSVSELYNIAFYATLSFTQLYFLYKKTQSSQGILVRADIVHEGSKDNWVPYNPLIHGAILFGNQPLSTHGSNYARKLMVKVFDTDGEKLYRREEAFKVPEDYKDSHSSLYLSDALRSTEYSLSVITAWHGSVHTDDETSITRFILDKDTKLWSSPSYLSQASKQSSKTESPSNAQVLKFPPKQKGCSIM